MKAKKFYITTSIAYTNASPHLGFALELIQADVLARFHRLLGQDVFFLTGTDEHGRKVAEAAAQAGQKPKEFTDQISGQFKKLTQALNISNDDFIRTSDQKRHWPSVRKAWLALKKRGDIYKRKYKGLYCLGCEAFITKKDLVQGQCKIHQRKPEVVEEENYFFRLSRYAPKIEEIIKKDKIKIIPASRKTEMLNLAKQGLTDVSFSRPSQDLKWGIAVPDDKSQIIYVWGDALINYISSLSYAKNSRKFKKYWPADVHCIGKDIQKFHCLIWPGMLLSLGLGLPKTILVHGFITVAGQKMSKSSRNIIDPFELVEKYGPEAVRYFLLREIPPNEDGDFTYQKFEGRYKADLAHGLGNLVARVITLAAQGKIKSKKLKTTNKNLKLALERTRKENNRLLNEFRFNEALRAIWQLISWCDKYIEKEKPWQSQSERVITDLLYALSHIAQILKPFLPQTSEKILEQIKTKKSQPLFPPI